jgi:hypothetical protein
LTRWQSLARVRYPMVKLPVAAKPPDPSVAVAQSFMRTGAPYAVDGLLPLMTLPDTSTGDPEVHERVAELNVVSDTPVTVPFAHHADPGVGGVPSVPTEMEPEPPVVDIVHPVTVPLAEV